MPKIPKELSAIEISRLTQLGHYAVGGVTGLYFYVHSHRSRSWVLRCTIGNKRRHIGLGSYPSVTLAQARAKAREVRDLIQRGFDPIQIKENAKTALKVEQASAITFAEAAQQFITSKSAEWKNPKHLQQWQNTLATYAFPILGDLPVKEINIEHILKVLEPIWKTKNETASRVRGRIENVLDWASARNYRDSDNPARWKGLLDKILPSPNKIQKVTHHAAMPIDETPPFFEQLRQRSSMSSLALQFTILCAARSGEVRGATWDEIDFENKVWTIPASRMKAGKEHRVPLSIQALDVLEQAKSSVFKNNFIFSNSARAPLSNVSMNKLMKTMNVNAVPHGFRSTFRDWAFERTNYSREIAEESLAHTLTNKVEAAYRRSDILEKRRIMMQDWANFVTSEKV